MPNRATLERRATDFSVGDLVLHGILTLSGLIITNAYLLDLVGQPITPLPVGVLVLLDAAILALAARRWLRLQVRVDRVELLGLALTTIAVFLVFWLPSLPNLYPPATSVDGAHHAILVQYIAEHHALPHDLQKLAAYLGEFHGYPPGPHILAALVANLLGVFSPLVMHTIASIVRALTAGYIFTMMYRLLEGSAARLLGALCAPVLLFPLADYFFGAIIGAQYFYGMIFGELILVAGWSAVLAGQRVGEPLSVSRLVLFGWIAVIQVFGYPSWLPLMAFSLALAVLASAGEWRRKALSLIVPLAPAALVLLQYLSDPDRRKVGSAILAWEGLASKATVEPWYAVFVLLGVVVALSRWRRLWAPLAVLAVCVAQTVGFYILWAGWRLSAMYHVYKSFYLYVYPLSMLGALAVAGVAAACGDPATSARVASLARRAVVALAGFARRINPVQALAAAGLALALVFAARAVQTAPWVKPIQVVNPDLVDVARWARQNIDVTDVGYIAKELPSTYWLHTALLGNQRFGPAVDSLLSLPGLTYDEWKNGGTRPSYLIIEDAATVPETPGISTVYQHGKAALLKRTLPQREVTVEHPVQAGLDNYLQVVGYSGAKQTLDAGGWFVIDVHWQALYWPPRFMAHYMYVHIVDDAGRSLAGADKEMLAQQYTRLHWPLGITNTERFNFQLPADMPAGRYYAKVGVYPGDTKLDLKVTDGSGKPMDRLLLGPFKVALPAAQGSPQVAVKRTFGQRLELLGYDLARSSVRPGEVLAVRLYWQALAPVAEDYTAFVHLVGKDGRPVAQCDTQPLAGAYPTSIWSAGEVMSFDCPVAVGTNVAANSYTLRTGLYNWQTLGRLPLDGGGDAVDLGAVTVIAP